MSDDRTEFEQQVDAQPTLGLLREFWDFLRYNKKWWMLPILIVLLLFGILIAMAGTPLAPFIYTLS